HFFTQPLPTRTAWYAHQLPQWLKRLSVAGTLVLELAVPPLIFGGRWLRRGACAGIVLLQLLIGGTGNYTFFNLLTVALALLLLEPLRSVNDYGLFRVMTTTRAEIVVEGSDDGETWQVYQFRYKPGEARRAPPLVEPHQPRLDWQMWFAALGSFDATPWFQA